MRKNVLVVIAVVTVSIVATVLAIYQYNKSQQIKKEYDRVVNLHSNTKKELEEVKTSLSAFKDTSPIILRREQDIQISERANEIGIYFEDYQNTTYDKTVSSYDGNTYEEYKLNLKDSSISAFIAPIVNVSKYGKEIKAAATTSFYEFSGVVDYSDFEERLLGEVPVRTIESSVFVDQITENNNGIQMKRSLVTYPGNWANLEYQFMIKDKVYRFASGTRYPVDLGKPTANNNAIRSYLSNDYPPSFQQLDEFIQTIEPSPY